MADPIDPRQFKGKRGLAQAVATRATDPLFYSALEVLPNPDTVLRRLGRGQEAFDAISGDAHVLGELRSVRSGLLRYEYRIQPGGDAPADAQAAALAEQLLERRPAPGMRWPEVIWNMAQAVFRGYQVHEVVWRREGRLLIPAQVLDRPQRRFVFDPDNRLRLLTRENPVQGIELGAYKWLLTRHMVSHDNPYGVAVYSACFWPYTFKHSGLKFFVKFAEKYGMPWPVGKYPPGTPKEQQDELLDHLENMVEDALAVIPDDASVELLASQHRGDQIHEGLVNLCNREMSKALTSQTLATEVQDTGSRAVAEVHQERQADVAESDREMIAGTLDQLFEWVTEINVPGARPPRFEFYEEARARKEWADVLSIARGYLDVPRRFAHERLQIPEPEEGEDVLPRSAGGAGNLPSPPAEFARGADPIGQLAEAAAAATDDLVVDMVERIREALEASDSLEQFRDRLLQLYPDLDESELATINQLVLLNGLLEGVDAANG